MPPPLCSARARPLRLLGAHPAALGGSTLPGGEGGRPGHWAPSHRLGCSGKPPQRSPISLLLTTQVQIPPHSLQSAEETEAKVEEPLPFACHLMGKTLPPVPAPADRADLCGTAGYTAKEYKQPYTGQRSAHLAARRGPARR
eukprot:scaffold49202_cov69-Phaeocystis_antarctica.AAC.1